MRQFHSYGPVDSEEHFCVPRNELIERGGKQLVGNPEKGGHFFTIWAPRQCGKTWLMRQVTKEIEKRHPDRFAIGMMSVQGVIMDDGDPDEVLFDQLPRIFRDAFETEPDPPKKWGD